MKNIIKLLFILFSVNNTLYSQFINIDSIFKPFAVSETIGRRPTMEDAHCIKFYNDIAFFGLFDGHGGRQVADFVANNLYRNIIDNLSSKTTPNEFHRIIENSFLKTSQDLDEQKFDSRNQGCTAITAIFNKNKIYVANLGDSRAVISNNGKAIPLSNDHKPNRPDEKERIEKLGGKVINYGVPRVQGVLAISRALGDKALNPFVSFVPEIEEYIINKNDEFLILACDGLWDVISNQEAVDIVNSAFKRHINCQKAADFLRIRAIDKGSQDNVTVIIIDLKKYKVESEIADRANFFKEILGISESQFIDFYKDKNKFKEVVNFLEIQEKPASSTFFLKNKKTGKCYQAGSFKEYSIRELREKTKDIQKIGGGKFNVIEARNTSGADYRKYVDIGALQADPANRDAVFQVASNFSALEPVSSNDYPEGGIEKYIYDYTQGPFAAISAAPGLIYRMYYIFYNKNNNPDLWRQKSNHQINLLDKTKIPCENGYIDLSIETVADYLNNPIALYEEIKIGYHKDIQVTYGFLNNLKEHTVVNNSEQIINQVFTAAVDFGATNSEFIENENAQKLAQVILDAAYEGTIRSAIINNKKKVFLTLIGGGVFNNRLSWIEQAIEKVIDVIQDYGIDVNLIIYDSNNSNMRDQMPNFRKKMQNLVKKTDGNYTIYGK